MSRWLYIFAGFPGKGLPTGTQQLGPGGLQYFVEEVEEKTGSLEHDPTIRLTKEGSFAVSKAGSEYLEAFQWAMSPSLEPDGITSDWFNENHNFGNGVTFFKSNAHYPTKTVIHGTQSTVTELLATGEVMDFGNSKLQLILDFSEGWEKYEKRWLPRTCPQETHVVHLTCLVATHQIPNHAYRRLWETIENHAAAPSHSSGTPLPDSVESE